MSAHRIYHRRKYEPGNYGKFNRNKIKKYEHNNQAKCVYFRYLCGFI